LRFVSILFPMNEDRMTESLCNDDILTRGAGKGLDPHIDPAPVGEPPHVRSEAVSRIERPLSSEDT
jgi:hypothetical protein